MTFNFGSSSTFNRSLCGDDNILSRNQDRALVPFNSIPLQRPASSSQRTLLWPPSVRTTLENNYNYLRTTYPRIIPEPYLSQLYSNNTPPSLVESVRTERIARTNRLIREQQLAQQSTPRPSIEFVDLTATSDTENEVTPTRIFPAVTEIKLENDSGRSSTSPHSEISSNSKKSVSVQNSPRRPSGRYRDSISGLDETVYPMEEYHGFCFCCFRVTFEGYTALHWPPRQDVDRVGIYEMMSNFNIPSRDEQAGTSSAVKTNDLSRKIHFPSHMGHGRCYCCYNQQKVHLHPLPWPPSAAASVTAGLPNNARRVDHGIFKSDKPSTSFHNDLNISTGAGFLNVQKEPRSIGDSQSNTTKCRKSNSAELDNNVLADIFGMSPISLASGNDFQLDSLNNSGRSTDLPIVTTKKGPSTPPDTSNEKLKFDCANVQSSYSTFPASSPYVPPLYASTQLGFTNNVPDYPIQPTLSPGQGPSNLPCQDDSLGEFRSFRVSTKQDKSVRNVQKDVMKPSTLPNTTNSYKSKVLPKMTLKLRDFTPRTSTHETYTDEQSDSQVLEPVSKRCKIGPKPSSTVTSASGSIPLTLGVDSIDQSEMGLGNRIVEVKVTPFAPPSLSRRARVNPALGEGNMKLDSKTGTPITFFSISASINQQDTPMSVDMPTRSIAIRILLNFPRTESTSSNVGLRTAHLRQVVS